MQIDALVKAIPHTFKWIIDIDEMQEPSDPSPRALIERFGPSLGRCSIPSGYFWASMHNKEAKRITLSMCRGTPTKIYDFKHKNFQMVTMFEVATKKYGHVVIYFYEDEPLKQSS